MGYTRSSTGGRNRYEHRSEPEIVQQWDSRHAQNLAAQQLWDEAVSGEAARIAQRQASLLEKEAQAQLDTFVLDYQQRDAEMTRGHRRQVFWLKALVWLLVLSLASLAGAVGWVFVKQIRPQLNAYRALQSAPAPDSVILARLSDESAKVKSLRAENEVIKADAQKLQTDLGALKFVVATLKDVLGGAPAALKAEALKALSETAPSLPAKTATLEPTKAQEIGGAPPSDPAKGVKHAAQPKSLPPLQARPSLPPATPAAATPRPSKTCKCQPGDPMCS
jgi:hypothetical protein